MKEPFMSLNIMSHKNSRKKISPFFPFLVSTGGEKT
jgi:hypothetical protein